MQMDRSSHDGSPQHGTQKYYRREMRIRETRKSIGSPSWARTSDLRINSPSLYQLSYRGTTCNYIGASELGSNLVDSGNVAEKVTREAPRSDVRNAR